MMIRGKQNRGILVSVVLLTMPGRQLLAQWATTNLHPTAFTESQVFAVTSSQQGGVALNPGRSASLWSGTAQSWGSFNGSGISGEIKGMFADFQVGWLNINARSHASLWHGTSASWIDLHPGGNGGSVAAAVFSNEQVGYTLENVQHAVAWHGTAGSLIDLHPVGMSLSYADATDGQRQGGSVGLPNGFTHAALWSGSAASFVDMNPVGAVNSQIKGMWPGQQVGIADFGVPLSVQAALWNGSAQSFVNLKPLGAGVSGLNATCGSAQVGWANLFSSGITAGIWFGSAQSFVPLAPFLPAGYVNSVGTSVAESNGVFYVGGYAYNVQTGNREAFLWTGIPAPGSMSVAAAALLAFSRRKR